MSHNWMFLIMALCIGFTSIAIILKQACEISLNPSSSKINIFLSFLNVLCAFGVLYMWHLGYNNMIDGKTYENKPPPKIVGLLFIITIFAHIATALYKGFLEFIRNPFEITAMMLGGFIVIFLLAYFDIAFVKFDDVILDYLINYKNKGL